MSTEQFIYSHEYVSARIYSFLKFKKYMKSLSEIICEERSILFKNLNELAGIIAYPSAANFILFRTPKNRATEIFLLIRQQGVLIKNLSNHGGLLSDCLRVTIGTPEENIAFFVALRKSLQEF